jgi:Yip1 domain
MNFNDWRLLAIASVKEPALAARSLLALNVPHQVLWPALVLVAALNAILFTLSNLLVPGMEPMPGMASSPLTYFAIVFGGLALTVFAVFGIGRLLGGSGTLNDIIVVIVWMQALRFVVQVAALVLVLTLPLLSVILVAAAGIIGIYILLNFINQAHNFGSIWKAAAVMIASVIAIVMGLSVLLSIFGNSVMGSAPYV